MRRYGLLLHMNGRLLEGFSRTKGCPHFAWFSKVKRMGGGWGYEREHQVRRLSSNSGERFSLTNGSGEKWSVSRWAFEV